jgi:ankyrin repeat protein
MSYKKELKIINPTYKNLSMARTSRRKNRLPTRPPAEFLTLPTEILLDIASFLTVTDIRRLGRVNRKLCYFAGDYLIRYRYNFGLVSLPNELILEIIQHLGRQRDRVRLAQASQRFYPIIVDHVLRQNVLYGRSSLLTYAATRNLKRMAQMMIHIGGDVNTQSGLEPSIMGKRPTPLANAAFHGHERMVRIFLNAGSSYFVDGLRIPLMGAILKRHENVAFMLSQELDSGDVPLSKTHGTALQMACTAKLVNLVRYYLELGSQSEGRPDVRSLCDRSIALYHTLQLDACRNDIVKRDLHENVYQIILSLLDHGANPDVYINYKSSQPATARTIASRHPDPRVRGLLSKPAVSISPRDSNLIIGRPWMLSPDNETFTPREPQSRRVPSEYLDISKQRVWLFFEELKAKTTILHDDGIESRGTNYEDYSVRASEIADLVEGEVRRLQKARAALPLSSFPQLSIRSASESDAAKDFWAKLPDRNPSTVNVDAFPPKVNKVEKPEVTEPFPRLGLARLTLNENARDLWSRFSMVQTSQNIVESQRISPGLIEENGMRPQVHNMSKRTSKKKKKWEPLLI